MRKIFLLRGAPGSGKSSFISRHHLQPYAISRDQIRLLLADLTVYYEEDTDYLHQVIPRHVTVRTEQMVDNLVEHKMSYGETVIVDGTHIVPSAIEHFKPWVDKYHYELFVVDLMQHKTLNSLLKRNQVRIHYDWVKPEVVKQMYNSYKAHPEVPNWARSITPNQMNWALSQKESNLDRSYFGKIKKRRFLIWTKLYFSTQGMQLHHPTISKKHDVAQKLSRQANLLVTNW